MKRAVSFLIAWVLIFALAMPVMANANEVSASTRRTIEPSKPMVAITLDDGPSGCTDEILDILEENPTAAVTFFSVGQRVRPWSGVIERAHRMGSEVVGHSWDHPNLTELSAEEIAWQLLETHHAIEEVLGTSVPRIFRPPFSAQNEDVRQVARDLGFAIIDWSVDSRDWIIRDAQLIADRILDSVYDGANIVMHDLGVPENVAALRIVIPELIARGYQLVTVSELLYYRGATLRPGRVYHNAPPLDSVPVKSIASVSEYHQFVPLRAIAEALTYNVNWNPETQTVTMRYITMELGSHYFTIDGITYHTPIAPFIYDGLMLITTCTVYDLFGFRICTT